MSAAAAVKALRVAVALMAGALPQWALAQADAWVPGKGHGGASFAIGGLSVHDHLSYRGDVLDAGRVYTQLAMLSLDYGLTDRLAISVSIPFIEKKYSGRRPHVPAFLEDPERHDMAFVDDGSYHGSWADYSLKLRYGLSLGAWAIAPHIALSAPSTDYPFFGHAAVGSQQTTLALGVDVGRTLEPPFQNFYVQAGYDYVVVEQERNVNVNRSLLNLEFGHLLRPGVVVKLLATVQKTHGGLDFPRDFRSFRDDQWLHHDQIQRSDYLNVGFGIDWQLNDQWGLFANYGRTVWGENTYEIRHAMTLGLSRSF